LTSHFDHPFAAHLAPLPPLRIWGTRLPVDLQRQLVTQVNGHQPPSGQHQRDQRWSMASAPPADVCIVGGAIAPSLLPSTFTVPLRVWLFDLAPDSGETPRMVRLADRSLPRSVPQALACVETLLSLRTASDAPDNAPLAQPSREALRDLVWHRFKLSRWPSASLLARHAWGYRLAPFLANSHLSLQNLVTLSGVSPSGCLAFLRDLLVHHHLRVDLYAERWPLSAQVPTLSVKVSEHEATAASRPPPPARGTTRPTAPTPAPATAHRLGLLSRLRQQLGLAHDKP
jgi:hypothetical protein